MQSHPVAKRAEMVPVVKRGALGAVVDDVRQNATYTLGYLLTANLVSEHDPLPDMT